MQAFAPLNEAVLQRKRDEYGAAQRMGELRLQAALAEEAQVRQQKFTQEENERGRTATKEENEKARRHELEQKLRDLRAQELREIDARIHAANENKLNRKSNEEIAKGDRAVRAQTAVLQSLTAQESVDEQRRQFDLKQPGTEAEVLMEKLAEIREKMDRMRAVIENPNLSEETRRQTAIRFGAFADGMKIFNSKMMQVVADPKTNLNDIQSAVKGWFQAPPPPPHYSTVTDIMGATRPGVVIPGSGTNGPVLMMLPQVNPDGTPFGGSGSGSGTNVFGVPGSGKTGGGNTPANFKYPRSTGGQTNDVPVLNPYTPRKQ